MEKLSIRLIYAGDRFVSRRPAVDLEYARVNSPFMETGPLLPDGTTASVCRWLSPDFPGEGYTGPDPGPDHDLAPLLSIETGRRDLYLTSEAAWFRSEQIVRPAIRRASSSGAEMWAVKGADLAPSVYPFPGGRPMCDIDLLVEKEHLYRVVRAFDSSGWTTVSPGWGIFTSGIVSELKLSRMGVKVEIHTHPLYFPATLPGRLPGDMFLSDRALDFGLRSLSWHNSLLYCILHMLTNTWLRPSWWVDVFLLSHRVQESGTWMEFSRNAAGTGLGRSIADLLSTAASALGAPVPVAVGEILMREGRSREQVLGLLRGGTGRPTLANLLLLRGWRKVSWLFPMLWLAATGGSILRSR